MACPKICCHGNGGRQGRNLNDTIGKPGPENRGESANSAQLLSFTGDRLIVNFVPKFVAMATGVGRGEIKVTPSNSLGPKIGGRCKQRAIISYGEQVIPL